MTLEEAQTVSFNDWFLSLEDGRKAVLRDDKWMLAEAAFNAGRTTILNAVVKGELNHE